MPYAYFSRVFEGTTLEDLRNQRLQQAQTPECQKIEYYPLIEIPVSQDTFSEIGKNLLRSHPCYAAYARQSIVTKEGQMQCILIVNKETMETLIFYTAGRSFPLYAGIHGQKQ
jgi:NADH dehydrogenase/NADH:ubiquinone oxidoreductase subunit G